MNPSMSSLYPSSFLSPTPDPASSAALQTQSPFIASTQAPNSLYLSRSTRWPGAQGPSSIESSPSPTNTMPSISVQREAQAQAPFQAVDLSLSRLTNGPTVNHQSHASLSPHSQHPPFLCNDSFSTDLKEKRPPRPSNAFILFRSDLLKRKFIFKGRETRQNKLSVIAAKCWDKLTREEKKKWFLEAEREKKAHAIKYADYRTPSQSTSRGARARSRSRDESRIMAPSPLPRDLEQERLGRLADMAYKEIINDVPSQLKRESTISPSPCMTASLASGTPTPPPRVQWSDLFTLDCYREQGQLSPQDPLAFSSPAGEEGHLSLTTSSASDFSTFQDAHVFPTVSDFTICISWYGFSSQFFSVIQAGFVGMPYPATIARPASCPMHPTASSFFGTTARQITTFPSEYMLQGSTSIDEQEPY
jgi:HMG (high mobility group) box